MLTRIIRVLSLLLFSASLALFLYGSMKLVREQQQPAKSLDLGGGIVLTQESPARATARTAFLAGGVLLGTAVIGLAVGRTRKKGRKKTKKVVRSQPA